MRSPKFAIRRDELKKVLNPASLKLAWKNTVRVAMRRQYIADPIEFMDFHSRIQAECELVAAQLSDGTYNPRKPRRVLVEKSRGLCRQLAVLDVRDALVLQCLSDAFHSNIKGKSPNKSAFFEPERHLFTGPLNEKRTYGSFRSWLEFQEQIFNFSKTRQYIIVTDIANFYDYISHSNLRNIITDYVDEVRESILDLLIFVLSELNWQPDYMPRAGVGLPQIDLDAPRLLAHCFLYELDKMMSRRSDVDYVRFMDDIDIGVDSIPAAKTILRDIDLTLHARQVRLNTGKTKILSHIDALEHFKIAENEHIASIEAHGKKVIRVRFKTSSGVTELS
jgi:Reverse transcriptase (RNA-dependent DNA polymerase)